MNKIKEAIKKKAGVDKIKPLPVDPYELELVIKILTNYGTNPEVANNLASEILIALQLHTRR